MCSFIFDDFDKVELESQLCTLHQLYSSVVVEEMTSNDSIKTALLSLSTTQRMLVSAVSHLFHQVLSQMHNDPSKIEPPDDSLLSPTCM